MKTLRNLVLAAAALAFSTSASAQLSLGEDCGCPDLASRSVVSLSSIATTPVAGGTGVALPAGATQLTCDNVYIIDNKIYVPNGAELYIEPGTVLKGTGDNLADADALIVARGGQMFASGTAECPIIFTSAGNVPSSSTITDPLAGDPLDGTFPLSNRGHWGGVIMLGTAPNNIVGTELGDNDIDTGIGAIEGLDLQFDINHYGAGPADATFTAFNDKDCSGVLRYVSIRHAGISIAANNEINGLTLGSVGAGTVLEHIEIVANADDGIEFFGGNVDLKYCAVTFVGDDGYDWDEGYSGRGQFWYSVENDSDKGWECDGDDNSGSTFYSNPTVYNATMLGEGGSGDNALSLKSETQGTIANSIFTAHEDAIDFNNDGDGVADGAVTFYLDGSLKLENNIFEAMTNSVNGTSGGLITEAMLIADGNTFLAAGTNVVDYTTDFDPATLASTDPYNPVPAVGTAGVAVSGSDRAPSDGFFSVANYKGAFEPGAEPWTNGWTVGALIGADDSIFLTCPTDTDRDGDTDVNDLLLLVSQWNTSCQ